MSEATRIPELFGSLVFNERTMEQYVPQSAMDVWRGCLKSGQPLPLSAANEIADAMKTWALEHGATHFTHWFQPLSGVTAEKHDSFINNAGGGRVMMDFSGKELVRGEPDASSFPNGGLRATFEARGYSAWDPTAFAFIKDGSLCIPTVFCSYSGDALDKKTPLLRSISAVNRASLRVLKLFGDDAEKVTPQIGAEQEYFLIDRELYLKRMDLRLCGRALFGAKPPKGQELDDHYFGAFRPRVAAYMKELDEELWKLGVLSKTKHNEVAPGQHEMAPIYTDANTASDQNQLVMETMKKVAERHNLVCLLHEKPFAGVNGSGKHVNWSLSTDTGKNLFSPGKTPSQNAVFLLVLAAFIKGVDEYQELLRCSVAFAGNDHRLGAQEAPPAVISVFLGTELEGIIDAIVDENDYTAPEHKSLRIGVDVLPAIPQDTTDRNRTSPVAFTGNKFEFRAVGSEANCACAMIALNAAVAEQLVEFKKDVDELIERGEPKISAILEVIRKYIKICKPIHFDGNGYSDEWKEEAKKRGLDCETSVPLIFDSYLKPESIRMFENTGVLTQKELEARNEVKWETYTKKIQIEARVLGDLAMNHIIPVATQYQTDLIDNVYKMKELFPSDKAAKLSAKNLELIEEIADRTAFIKEHVDAMIEARKVANKIESEREKAIAYHDTIVPAMEEIRYHIDKLELIVDNQMWTLPKYRELLFIR